MLTLLKVQTKWAEFLVHFMENNVPSTGGNKTILTKKDATKIETGHPTVEDD